MLPTKIMSLITEWTGRPLINTPSLLVKPNLRHITFLPLGRWDILGVFEQSWRLDTFLGIARKCRWWLSCNSLKRTTTNLVCYKENSNHEAIPKAKKQLYLILYIIHTFSCMNCICDLVYQGILFLNHLISFYPCLDFHIFSFLNEKKDD